MVSQTTRVAVALSALAVTTGVILYKTRKPHQPSISRSQFLEIMTKISQSAFEILFEYAQMAARVEAASGHRQPFTDSKTVRSNDPYLRECLSEAQSRILSQHNVTERDLMSFEKSVKSDPQVASVLNSIPDMFNAYCEGRFPVLSTVAIPSDISDEDLLRKLEESLSRNTQLEISLKNLVSVRINESENFRDHLSMLIVNIQNSLRARLPS